jgi:hypothetical protein
MLPDDFGCIRPHTVLRTPIAILKEGIEEITVYRRLFAYLEIAPGPDENRFEQRFAQDCPVRGLTVPRIIDDHHLEFHI